MGGDICYLMSVSLLDLGRFATLLLSFIGTFKQPSFLMWKVRVTSAFHVSVYFELCETLDGSSSRSCDL